MQTNCRQTTTDWLLLLFYKWTNPFIELILAEFDESNKETIKYKLTARESWFCINENLVFDPSNELSFILSLADGCSVAILQTDNPL